MSRRSRRPAARSWHQPRWQASHCTPATGSCWPGGSCTRDEKHVTDADQFRLERDQGRHLAWGAGAHRCLGQHLARVELGVVIREVLEAMPDHRLALAPGQQIETTYGVIRGVRSLPVTWTP
ncbi:cytochrome P450 [Kibdelosporangium banguiense]|uniref:Cytochrome P450 n=1 Tax=Kibdelosporangium banguiense TaxID=1365924 RepID=A0ABS4TWR9_9PSEU|nr:cytochrome P450 [Kibdelosporangium banguiense]MBP2328861.1 cytochrome P450 [Kibdelosporangium banguiense]